MIDSEVVVRSDNRTIQIHRKPQQNEKVHRQMSENQGKLSAEYQRNWVFRSIDPQCLREGIRQGRRA